MDEENIQQIEQTTQEPPVQEQQVEKKDDRDYNFTQIRKQLKEKDDVIRHLQEQVTAIQQSTRKEIQEDPEIENDDFVTRNYLEKKTEKIAQRKVEDALYAYDQRNYRAKAKETYSDFDSVVTPENIQKLEEELPEIAKIISQSKDKVEMALGAYKAIKTLTKSSSMEKEIKDNREAIEKNKKEPLSVAAIDRRPIAQAARLTEKDYENLWQEMQHYANKA